MAPLFTVFTPTYNRAYILPKLYDSLCAQTKKDFEWLIVDDGSTDETEELVSSWLSIDNGFKINYIKKENGGKPRAINFGVNLAQGKYFFLMDSDDHLLSEAMEKMTQWVAEIDGAEDFIGVGAAKGYPDITYIKGVPPTVNDKGYVDATNLERCKYNLDADMCEAYRTDLFRKFPMAEWPGEKFAPEQIALNEIALAGYKLRWHSDIIYVCDYLEDGLTKGSRKLEKNNPMGYAMMYDHMLKYGYSFKRSFFCACQAIAFALYAKQPKFLLRMNSKWMAALALPFGAVLSIRRAIQFRKV
ncbi:MAG: glycosyltransferase family 2 protein [Ruminococcaceae bacterium]|nr:glycosyltransferase family 2 protein [Oscillospiraceae bacterium]